MTADDAHAYCECLTHTLVPSAAIVYSHCACAAACAHDIHAHMRASSGARLTCCIFQLLSAGCLHSSFASVLSPALLHLLALALARRARALFATGAPAPAQEPRGGF